MYECGTVIVVFFQTRHPQGVGFTVEAVRLVSAIFGMRQNYCLALYDSWQASRTSRH